MFMLCRMLRETGVADIVENASLGEEQTDQMKNVCNMLNLRNVDCRKCSCYVACCEKQGLQI